MFDKDALEVVNNNFLGFYSCCLLVEKGLVGWRPLIHLSPLNLLIWQNPFKMETVASILNSIRECNFMVLIDLKDVCFQVYPFIDRLASSSTLSAEGSLTSSRYFTLVYSQPSSVHLSVHSDFGLGCAQGLRLLCYLYDWLILGSTSKDLDSLLSLFQDLEMIVNWEKS